MFTNTNVKSMLIFAVNMKIKDDIDYSSIVPGSPVHQTIFNDLIEIYLTHHPISRP